MQAVSWQSWSCRYTCYRFSICSKRLPELIDRWISIYTPKKMKLIACSTWIFQNWGVTFFGQCSQLSSFCKGSSFWVSCTPPPWSNFNNPRTPRCLMYLTGGEATNWSVGGARSRSETRVRYLTSVVLGLGWVPKDQMSVTLFFEGVYNLDCPKLIKRKQIRIMVNSYMSHIMLKGPSWPLV